MVVYVCKLDGCIYSSITWQVWVEHVSAAPHNRVPCTVDGCYSSFPARRYYLQHFNEQHKVGRSTYVCSLCARPYKTKRAAKNHCRKPCVSDQIGTVVEVPAVPDVAVPVMVGFNQCDLGVVVVTVSASAVASHSSYVAPAVVQSDMKTDVNVVTSTSTVVSSSGDVPVVTGVDAAFGGGEASGGGVAVPGVSSDAVSTVAGMCFGVR